MKNATCPNENADNISKWLILRIECTLSILYRDIPDGSGLHFELGVETPFIDEIMEGASSTRGKQILKGEKISLEQCLSGTCAIGFPPT